MKRYAIVAALLASPLWVLPAQADWQFTKWGMTPEEVITASNGVAKHNDDSQIRSRSPVDGSQSAIVSMPYSTDSFSFEVNFLFKDNHLSSVDLNMTQGDNLNLKAALRSKYGPGGNGASESGRGNDWWTDTDHIALMVAGRLAFLSYTPRDSSNTKGL